MADEFKFKTIDGTEPATYDVAAPDEAADVGRPPVRRAPDILAGNRPQRTDVDRKRIARFDDPLRFTLRGLLFVVTLASCVLAVGIRFPRPIFAGAAGLAALVTALGSKWIVHGGAALQLAWWTLLGIYLMACAFAVLQW